MLYYSSFLQLQARHSLCGTFTIQSRLVQVTAFCRAYRRCRQNFRIPPAVQEYINQLTVRHITEGTHVGPEWTGMLAFQDEK